MFKNIVTNLQQTPNPQHVLSSLWTVLPEGLEPQFQEWTWRQGCCFYPIWNLPGQKGWFLGHHSTILRTTEYYWRALKDGRTTRKCYHLKIPWGSSNNYKSCIWSTLSIDLYVEQTLYNAAKIKQIFTSMNTLISCNTTWSWGH